MRISIDIVVPSFRLNEQYIIPILNLTSSSDTDIRFYLVADNPAVTIASSIHQKIDNHRVFLHVNDINRGAAHTRNKGIDMGQGDWILFLDDDIRVPQDLLDHYVRAIVDHPAENGFIGLVNFPKAETPYAQAVVASGSMDIFSVARTKDGYAWGATANMMVKRAALNGIRFSDQFPKAGGGEDVDFFLNIREANGVKNFKSLPSAAVEHPWWNNGRSNWERPYRYGKANSILSLRHPQYSFRDLLNTVETMAVLLIAMLISLLFDRTLSLIIGMGILLVLLAEILANSVQAIKRTGNFNPTALWYNVLLKLSFQYGMLIQTIRSGRWSAIGERFNDDGKVRKWNLVRLNSYKITKWIVYPLIGYLLLKIYQTCK